MSTKTATNSIRDALTAFRRKQLVDAKATDHMWVLASSCDAKKKMEVDLVSHFILQERVGIYVFGASRTREKIEQLLPDAQLQDFYMPDVATGKVEIYGTPASDRELYFVHEMLQGQTWQRERFEYLPRALADAALSAPEDDQWIYTNATRTAHYCIVRTAATSGDLDIFHDEWGC